MFPEIRYAVVADPSSPSLVPKPRPRQAAPCLCAMASEDLSSGSARRVNMANEAPLRRARLPPLVIGNSEPDDRMLSLQASHDRNKSEASGQSRDCRAPLAGTS